MLKSSLISLLLFATSIWLIGVFSQEWLFFEGDILFERAVGAIADRDWIRARDFVRRASLRQNGNAYYIGVDALLSERLCAGSEPIRITVETFCKNQTLLSEGVGLFKQSIRLSPNDPSFHHNLGWLMLMQGHTGPALAAVKHALSLDPSIALFHLSMGFMHDFVSKPEEAEVAYANALAVSPAVTGSRLFREHLGVNRQARVVSVAATILERRLARMDSPINRARLGQLRLWERRLNEAERHLSSAIGALPALVRARLVLNELRSLTGDNVYGDLTFESLMASDPYERNLLSWQLARGGYSRAGVLPRRYVHDSVFSPGFAGAFRRYRTATRVTDDIVPFGWLRYCNPEVLVVQGVSIVQ